MNLGNVIGNENLKLQLLNSLNSGRLSHAHIFAGDDGIGKSIIARGLAYAILGKTVERQYADIIEWRIQKGRQSIGIKDVIGIIEEINKRPYEGNKKVIIIHDAHLMTDEAQNALLKTIEEPPGNVYIILLCKNIGGILQTIISRCQMHRLKRLDKDEMSIFLKRRYPKLSDEKIKLLISFSEGIPGRCEKLIDNSEFKTIRDMVLEILSSVKNQSVSKFLEFEKFFVQYKLVWKDVLDCFLSYIRDTIIYKETGSSKLIINVDKLSKIKQLANEFSFNDLVKVTDIINNTGIILVRNINFTLAFDTMLLKIQEV